MVVGQQQAVQLLAHPDRQNPQRRRAEVTEQRSQPVEEVDAPQTVDAEVHAHQAGDRPGGADAGDPHRVERPPEQVRSQAAEQVEAEVQRAAEGDLQGEAEQEEEQHVAGQVAEVAVQEHRAEQPLHAELRRDEAEAVAADLVAGLFGALSGLLPARIGLVGRVMVDALFELQVAQRQHRQLVTRQRGECLLFAFVQFAAMAEGVEEQRPLAAQQAAVEVELDRLFLALAVAALVAEVDQHVEQDQQQGDDRRFLPVQRVFGGEDQHAGPSLASRARHQLPRLLSMLVSRPPSKRRK
ncbi:hypothetical protein D9M69_382000 [compost metagenome]